MTPQAGDRRYDQHGEVVCMAVASGYVMARRPGKTPFVRSVKEWQTLSSEPVEPAPVKPVEVVWAGSHEECLQWCSENNRSPIDRRLVLVWDGDSAGRLRGLAGPLVVRYGAWQDSPQREEIEAWLRIAAQRT